MVVTVTWGDDDRTYIRHTFRPNWRWDDLVLASNAAWDLMRSVNYTVDAIADFRGVRTFPRGSAMVHSKYVANNRPKNAGILVVVDPPTIFLEMYKMFDKLNRALSERTSVKFTKSFDEGLVLIREVQRHRDNGLL